MVNFLQLRQLKAILYKNYLLKRANVLSTAAEVFLPVIFMALLILIKQITTQYNSPNVAYYCGNAAPWYYTESLSFSNIADNELINCQVQPPSCTTSNYYQDGYNFPGAPGTVYSQLGYVSSGSGLGTQNPAYTYTIADDTEFYNNAMITNPSMTLENILNRFSTYGVLLAVAAGNGASLQTTQQATNLTSYIQAQAPQYQNSVM